MAQSPGALWRHRHFRLLWSGQAASMLGSWIGAFAFSLVAILTLHAGAPAVALLNGCSVLPGLLVAPGAGIWADRVNRRMLLLLADTGRAFVLASVPLAAILGWLTLVQLCAVAALMSVLNTVFTVTFRAYVPAVVDRPLLLAANSLLNGTEAATEAAGFALAGPLVATVTAPMALAIDALSFAASALSFIRLRGADLPPERTASPSSRAAGLSVGLRCLLAAPALRAVALTTLVWETAGNAVGVVITLYFVHTLHLSIAALGPIFAVGGLSAVAGAALATPTFRLLGRRRVLVIGLMVSNLGLLGVILAGGPAPLVLAVLALEQATDGGRTLYEIGVTTIVGENAPAATAGQTMAAYEGVRSIALVLGLVLGAGLTGVVGLRGVLIVALAIDLLAPVPLLLLPAQAMLRGDSLAAAVNSA